MAMKSAAVLALDVSCADAAALEKAREVCLQTALDKMLFAPNDELGLVLSGTTGTLNPLHRADPGEARYAHITVANEVNKPSHAFLASLLALDPSQPQAGRCDVLETLAVCAHQLQLRTEKKKYNRRIYLLTDAKDEVAHKQEITALMEQLRSTGVSVVVVSIDFTQETADVHGDWEGLGTKAENERVLHYLCATLHEADGASTVVSLADTLEGLQELRRRNVLQRSLAKLVLTVGDVKLATQLHSKIVPEKIPPLKKATRDGAEVGQLVDYVRVGDAGAADRNPTGGRGPQHAETDGRIGVGEVVRALRYGRSLVPCSDAEVEAMKIKGPRGLEGVGYVRQDEIPPYIVTGAARALLPLSGDAAGQRGFDCLVEAMLQRRVTLIVRYVSRTDARPALGVCLPARKARNGQYALYYGPLPFTEDVRLYRFSEYTDVLCTPAEEALMESLVSDMTVDRHTLRPSATHNPEVHQYFATVRAKILRASAAVDAGVADGVPELLPQLQRTSAAFTTAGNALAPLLRAAQPALESCATAFPYIEVDPAAAAKGTGAGGAWFNASTAALSGGDGVAMADDGAWSTSGPTTVAAPALAVAAASVQRGVGGSEAPSSVSTVAATAGLASGKIHHVTSIDPVGSFRAILEAAPHDPATRTTAMDELVDVTFNLLHHSIKGSLFAKCDDCVQALRAHCVAEEDPAYFNTFLSKLQATAQELELGGAYWQAHIVAGSGIHPITRRECKTSAIADEKAAREFMAQDRALPAVDLDEDVEDDFMDLIV